jgi:dUTP pyrophosphatase
MSCYYNLNIAINDNNKTLTDKYSNYLNLYNVEAKQAINDNTSTFDAGFDLFSPISLNGNEHIIKLNHNIKCSMTFTDVNNNTTSYCGYYLYSRSSTATKTPLRLANCVGIIDSGYRGNIIACFDNIREETYNIEQYQRLVQICPPNLTYPMVVHMVDVNELNNTTRGEMGFGSTGN